MNKMDIKKPFIRVWDWGAHAVANLGSTMAEKKRKKQELRTQLMIRSGSIKRVK